MLLTSKIRVNRMVVPIRRFLRFGSIISLTCVFGWWTIPTINIILSKLPQQNYMKTVGNSVNFEWIANKTPQSSLSPNFYLWSKRPDSVNWSKPVSYCRSILSSRNTKGVKLEKSWSVPYRHNDESMAHLLSNCTDFFDRVPFPNAPESNEEAEYPLAYVVMGTRNAAQTVRLFRMIYQPQNAYCLVYDNSSSENYKKTIQNLARCFPAGNVLVTPKPEVIGYGNFLLLKSVMVCMNVLLDMAEQIRWKYVQIVSWNDFPLRTNGQLVKIFKILNGSQDSPLEKLVLSHFAKRSHWNPPPHQLTLYKGSHATSMSREFIQFALTDPVATSLYDWLNDTWAAEEIFWATIIHNVQLNAPGLFPGQCLQFYRLRKTAKSWASRYEVWSWERKKCKGKITHFSCVFGIEDLPMLIGRPEFVVHKIYQDFQPLTNFCLEQLYWERVRNASDHWSFNENYYQQFPSVRYHNLDEKRNFEC